ncbi:hypothetical protein [Actinospica robiniae]|uniref:hypothetical protein n=1 Tax=Actinospica robiniae TaxID=304901 RepID=UPI00041BA674|nr:hypothetical protein [Actinospica robiniae]
MEVVEWLLAGDPSVRWQAVRDLTDAPGEQIARERARVAGEGWGAHLLEAQREDGHWEVTSPEFDPESPAAKWWDALQPGQKGTLMPAGTSTTWSLALLRAFGVDPEDEAVRRAVARVAEHCLWEHDGQRYFDGEVEPCINGRAVALGAYFGQSVAPIVRRLLGEQMEDGGWNCEQENGSTRGSFHTTIDVLEGLLEFETAARAGWGGQAADADLIEQVEWARLKGQEYLLERRLMNSRSTGKPIEQDRKTEARATWTQFSFPTYWHYDVLRALDYLRAADARPEERMADAIDLVESKRDQSGRWPAEHRHPGRLHFPLDDGEGEPSRWNTLRALRVLRWYR